MPHTLTFRANAYTDAWTRCDYSVSVDCVFSISPLPSCERLIEGRGLGEHGAHIQDVCGVPAANRLVERRSELEHIIHVRDARGIPACERLVEGSSARKHEIHIRHVAAHVDIESKI